MEDKKRRLFMSRKIFAEIDRKVLIATGMAVLAFVLSGIYLYAKAIELTGGGIKSVIVAREDIPRSSQLTPEMVAIKKIPSSFVEPDAVRDLAEISSSVNILPLDKGAQLTRSKIEKLGIRGGLSAKVREGERGVSVEVDMEDMSAGLVRPNDRVDILGTFDLGSNDLAKKETRLLFQDVSVVAVGSLASEFAEKEKDAVSSRSKIVTFSMDVDSAQKFILAKESAKISLALRSPSDRAVFEGDLSKGLESILGRDQMIFRKFKEYRGR